MTDAYVSAEKLLQAGAVRLRPQEPFTWASGWKSPIYCDNRKLLSQPFIRDFIKSELCNVIFEKFGEAGLIAGVATAGIPWGAMVADQLKLPFIYVRPRPKEHGLGNQIEGEELETCAVREVKEETGLHEVKTESVLCTTFHTYHENRQHILKETHWYLMKAKKEKLHPQTEEDIEKCEWVAMDLLDQYTDSYLLIRDVINEGLKKLSKK